MGWEAFRSIWDEPIDDKPNEENKAGGKRKKLSWWEEFEEDRASFTTGADADADSFSYRSAFDDSDKSWYKQSSFRYGSYPDYSPSRLFRSSLTGFADFRRSDNDAQNKAIRALRTLTRNANTVANAANKITYSVQFSAGSAVNSLDTDIASGKTQTIYVSPDTVVSADNQNDEDAAVDALTGFVLLQVQLSQEVANDIIVRLNACNLRAMPAALTNMILEGSWSAADSPKLSAAVVDQYLAGVLAKSMLMRICRRAVVEDWGGFAPYFVRHAKKFVELREVLEKEQLSLEVLAKKIAYNMVAAEDEIPIDAEIAVIIDKHLGAQMEYDAILPNCQNLITELRAYLADKMPAEEVAGKMEADIGKGLSELLTDMAEYSRTSTERGEAARDCLEDLANVLDAMHADDKESDEATALKFENAEMKLGESVGECQSLRYTELAVNKLKKIAKEMAEALEEKEAAQKESDKAVTAATSHAKNSAAIKLRHALDKLRYALRSNYGPIERAVDSANKAGKTVKHPHVASTLPDGVTTEDVVKQQIKEIKDFVEQISDYMKNALKKAKETAAKSLSAVSDDITAAADSLKEFLDLAEQLKAKAGAAAEKFNSAETTDLSDTSNRLARLLADQIEQHSKITTAVKDITDGKTTKLRSAAAIYKFCQDSSAALRNIGQNAAIGNILRQLHYSASSAAMSEFEQQALKTDLARREFEADNPGEKFPVKDWHNPAIEKFLRMSQNGGMQAKPADVAMAETNKELFETLRKMLKEALGFMPSRLTQLKKDEHASLTAAIKNAAKNLGMTEEQLMAALKNTDEYAGSSKEIEAAKKLGQVIEQAASDADGSSPVDEQLFGETVRTKTVVLDGKAISNVNDEASNAPEEEYVAYLSHNSAKPRTVLIKPGPNVSQNARNIVAGVKSRGRGAIERIRSAFRFQGAKRTGEVYGMRAGDLDEGSLHKLGYDSEHIWTQKTISKLPDVAVGILVDQSGSMSSGYGSGTKISQAREMCILLAEALKRIDGVHLHIYGHTANRGSRDDLQLFEHYSSTGSAANADLTCLGEIAAMSNNYDGYAIKETAKLLSQDPAKRKYLFVIADGLPHGTGYSGDNAEKHVTSVCSFVRTRLKIPTYAFAVGVPDNERKTFEAQYGANNVVFLSTVARCLPQIVRFLRNTLQKEKNLVDVSAD